MSEKDQKQVSLGYVIILFILLLVVACSTIPPGDKVTHPGVDTEGNEFTESDVHLNDGRTIHCLFWISRKDSHAAIAGMDCDWNPK